jgi:hypothetical protein
MGRHRQLRHRPPAALRAIVSAAEPLSGDVSALVSVGCVSSPTSACSSARPKAVAYASAGAMDNVYDDVRLAGCKGAMLVMK